VTVREAQMLGKPVQLRHIRRRVARCATVFDAVVVIAKRARWAADGSRTAERSEREGAHSSTAPHPITKPGRLERLCMMEGDG
jgi:hypothetical protein